MVTHKFRLCLHPLGSSVSSRYTFPLWAWLGVFCFLKIITSLLDFVHTKDE